MHLHSAHWKLAFWLHNLPYSSFKTTAAVSSCTLIKHHWRDHIWCIHHTPKDEGAPANEGKLAVKGVQGGIGEGKLQRHTVWMTYTCLNPLPCLLKRPLYLLGFVSSKELVWI